MSIKKKFISYIKNYKNLYGTENICFVWIPKCAGSSIFIGISEKLGMVKLKKNHEFTMFPNFGAVTFGHVHLLSLIKLGTVSQNYFKKSYKFTIVRNPYTRVVSLYNYLLSHSKIKQYNFDEFLEEVELFRPPVGLYNGVGLSQTNPQVDWVVDEKGHKIVNDIFKVEKLELLYKKFLNLYKINVEIKEKQNVSTEIVNFKKDILGNKSRLEKINKIYYRDFKFFKYKMIY